MEALVSLYSDFTCPELRNLLLQRKIKVGKCTKNEMIRRLELWDKLGLAEGLLKVVLIPAESSFHFPNDDKFVEVAASNKKLFQHFSLKKLTVWFKQRKAMASHGAGRTLAIKKFVKYIQLVSEGQVCFIKCKCAAQTTKHVDHSIQIVVNTSTAARILQATCSCPAGEGWSAACKHIAALAFNLEYHGLSGETMELVSKTSMPQAWGRPQPGRQVQPMSVRSIQSCALPMVAASQTARSSLIGLLQEHVPDSPLFHKPRWAEEVGCEGTLEERTRGQSSCPLWLEERRKKITASMVWEVMRTVEAGNFSSGPAKRQLDPPEFSAPAVDWGRVCEPLALRDYEKVAGCRVQPCGLFVSKERSYFGASPDGVTDDGSTLVEVKCPYSIRFQLPSDASFLSGGFLDRGHKYYGQVQGQMYASGRKRCDFVVWTKKGILIELIKKDKSYVERMLHCADVYYDSVFRPMICALNEGC